MGMRQTDADSLVPDQHDDDVWLCLSFNMLPVPALFGKPVWQTRLSIQNQAAFERNSSIHLWPSTSECCEAEKANWQRSSFLRFLQLLKVAGCVMS